MSISFCQFLFFQPKYFSNGDVQRHRGLQEWGPLEELEVYPYNRNLYKMCQS